MGLRGSEGEDEGQGEVLGMVTAVAGPWAETLVGNCGCCCPSLEPGQLCSPPGSLSGFPSSRKPTGEGAPPLTPK